MVRSNLFLLSSVLLVARAAVEHELNYGEHKKPGASPPDKMWKCVANPRTGQVV